MTSGGEQPSTTTRTAQHKGGATPGMLEESADGNSPAQEGEGGSATPGVLRTGTAQQEMDKVAANQEKSAEDGNSLAQEMDKVAAARDQEGNTQTAALPRG
eukprot:CAMPEP_0202764792 /NCGR_PEP_ID=MMETSP1388-20130828/26876_1 /ASSEMBLY_ACC=CAM_ASM_000864 /TAXON_ID=37098 /ORGANISM="Isochrysis sp, Strain CCMP1244" /LENGTH=100 /DNA_ID=CAMNT_0049433307 /DNA_START=51 /DNA_END=355 /DNA_ORIENTATION=-